MKHSFETERLWAEAKQTRAAAIRTRISAAQTFCTVAESAAQLHSLAQAQDVLAKVESTIKEIERHIEEPHHVPMASIDELRELLSKLKTRAEKTAALLKSRSASQDSPTTSSL